MIEFPNHFMKEWTQIELILRENLSKNNYTDEMQDEVMRKMGKFCQRFDLQFTIPFDMSANLSEQQKESVYSAVNLAFIE